MNTSDKTKVILLFFFTIAALTIVNFIFDKFGYYLGGMVIVLISVAAYIISQRVTYWRKRSEYKDRRHDYWVVSDNPETGEKLILNCSLDKYIMSVPHSEVLNTVAEIEYWLAESGNKYFKNPDLSKDEQLQVFGEPFQDAEAPNEEWGDDYPERIKDKIKTRRSIRYPLIKKEMKRILISS